jgi:flagellar biosynthesis protein FlhG
MVLTRRPVDDQAAGLRQTLSQGNRRRADGPPLLAVASGKGGVGKTFLALNLALALSDQGRSCVLMDLDWGLANLDIALGLAPQRHLGHVLAGTCTVGDALIDGDGLTLLPNACGEVLIPQGESLQIGPLIDAIVAARPGCRLVIADTHPGLSAGGVDVVRQSAATVVVSTTEPTSITDTYALIKVLLQGSLETPIGLVINQAPSAERAEEAAQRLDMVSRRFLGRGVPYWGCIPQDAAVAQSVHRQRPLLRQAPRGRTAAAIQTIASSLSAVLDSRRMAGGAAS